jgi:nucleoside-diphosphate-sugar epimerase
VLRGKKKKRGAIIPNLPAFVTNLTLSDFLASDLAKTDSYKHLLPHVNAVVDTTSPDFSAGNPKANHIGLLEALKTFSKVGQKKTYIYTGGILTGGDHPFVKDESYTDTLPAMQWRADLEADVFSYSNALNTLVIRPGYVFGGAVNAIHSSLFGVTDKIVINGRPDKIWSWIHVDDLAELYVHAVNKASIIGPQVFYAGTTGSYTYEQIAKKAAAVAGKPNLPVEVVKAEGFFAVLDIDARVTSKKAFELLGWVAKHLDFYEELDIYYSAWKAASKL